MSGWIVPGWDAPPNVRAVATTRLGGVSAAPYDSMNLGDHVGDAPEAVQANRQRLVAELGLPSSPCWLEQVHGPRVLSADSNRFGLIGDGAVASKAGRVCAVLTADCLPVLICDRAGSRVAAVHAGWRGLLAGVLESALDRMGLPPDRLLAWLGPAIGPDAYEVGSQVRDAFVTDNTGLESAFRPTGPGRWLADLYSIARFRLRSRGLLEVSGGDCCTFADSARFYSYRRDGITGRMATLIWRVD